MDYNGDQALKTEIHPLVKLLWDAGVQYEDKVIASIKNKNSDKSFIEISSDSPDLAALALETNDAMKKGADYIYQGVLISGNRIGRPDLLIKSRGKSIYGDHLYYPVDIKLAQIDGVWDSGDERLNIEQMWQLRFYGDLLEEIQGTRPAAGFIYKTKSRQLRVDLFKLPYKYEKALNQLNSFLLGDPQDAEPAISSNCKMCEWKKYCVKWAEDKNDISTLFYVGDAMKTGLNKLEIYNIDDLAGQNPEELVKKVQTLKQKGFFWSSLPDSLIHSIIKRAKVTKTQKPVIYEEIKFPSNNIEIHFDIEGDPTQDFVYLHGLLLVEKGKEPVYHSFFADKYEDEALITQKLFDFLNKYKGVPVYHYADYEKTTLKRLIKKHNLNDQGVFDMLFGENGSAIDLYNIITEKTDWPLTSYSIKAICKYLGFKWDAKDASGSSSIVWLNDYLAGDNTMKEKILQYNEDDCQATLFLKNKLIEMQASS